MKLGGQAAIYFSTGSVRTSWPTSGAAASLQLIKRVGDVTIGYEKGDEDSTTRDTNGFETSFAALIKAPINIKLIYDPTDSSYQALEANMFSMSGTTLCVACLDGPATTNGSRGLWADMEVFEWKKGEPVKGLQTVDVVLKPALNINAGTNLTNAQYVIVGQGSILN
jgi:hypothetical protein